jgi:hypothetical protein
MATAKGELKHVQNRDAYNSRFISISRVNTSSRDTRNSREASNTIKTKKETKNNDQQGQQLHSREANNSKLTGN